MKTLKILSICLAFTAMNVSCMELINKEITKLKKGEKNISRILLSVTKNLKNKKSLIVDDLVMCHVEKKLVDAGFDPTIHYCKVTRSNGQYYHTRQKAVAKLLEEVRAAGSLSGKKAKQGRPIGVWVLNEHTIDNVHKHNIHHKEILETCSKNKNVKMLVLGILNTEIVIPEKVNKDSLDNTFEYAEFNKEALRKVVINSLESSLK